MIPAKKLGPPIAALFDDDKRYLGNISKRFRRYGFKVVADHDFRKFKTKIRNLTPPIATGVLDWVDQRGGNFEAGLEVASILHRKDPGCFLVLTTGHADELKERFGNTLESAAKEAGADSLEKKGELGFLTEGPDQFQRKIIAGILNKRARAFVKNNSGLDNTSVAVAFAEALASDFQPARSMNDKFPATAPIEEIVDAALDAAYDRLTALLSKPDSNEKEYGELMAEIRRLQSQEAKRMEDFFESRRPLPQKDAEAFLRNK